MIAIIDTDSIVYIAAWHNREEQDAVNWLCSVDNIVNTMLMLTGATGYYGVFSDLSSFRYDRYRFKPYKGNRPEKEPWFRERETIIKEYLCRQWGFFKVLDLEADDVVCWLAEMAATDGKDYVVCSPDKDLKQIPGVHYDYSKDIKCTVTPEEADYHFWMQMLTGDETDNIAGVPGIGEKKASEILKNIQMIERRHFVENAYYRYFGSYYGGIIFAETYDTVRLMHEHHVYYGQYKPYLMDCVSCYRGYTASLKAPASAESAIALFG
jgi:hypothetical protein